MLSLGSSHFARRYFGNHWPLFHKSRQIWKPGNEMSSRRNDEIAAWAAFRRSNEEIAHFWASSWSGRILASFFVAHRQRGSCHSFLLASRICLKFAPSNWWHLWNRGRYCFLFFRLLRCFTSADTQRAQRASHKSQVTSHKVFEFYFMDFTTLWTLWTACYARFCGFTAEGFPIRTSPDQRLLSTSPKLFAATPRPSSPFDAKASTIRPYAPSE